MKKRKGNLRSEFLFNEKRVNSKRSQANIIVSVLLIAIVIVAIFVIFNIVKPLVTEKSGGISKGFADYVKSLFQNEASSSGNTYYLDAVNGNNSNPGTNAQPWKTMERARPVEIGGGPDRDAPGNPYVQPGDTVILKSGNYGFPRWLWLNNSDWITYKADAGASVNFTEISLGSVFGNYTNIIFDGINVIQNDSLAYDGGLISLEPARNVIFRNCYVEGRSGTVDGSNSMVWSDIGFAVIGNNITIDNCTVYNFNSGIAFMETDSFVLRNSKVHHCRDLGVGASGLTNGLIEGNEIYDSFGEAASGVHPDIIQIYIGDKALNQNITIRNNKFYNAAYSQGVFLKWMENVVIENNIFYGPFMVHTNDYTVNSISGIVRNNTYIVDSSNSDFAIGNGFVDWVNSSNYSLGDSVIISANNKTYTCLKYHTSNSTNKPTTGQYWQTYWRETNMTSQIYNNIMLNGLNIDNNFGTNLIEHNNVLASFVTPASHPQPDASDFVYGPPYTTKVIFDQRAALFVNIPRFCRVIQYSYKGYQNVQLGISGVNSILTSTNAFTGIKNLNPYSVELQTGDNALECYRAGSGSINGDYGNCWMLRIKNITDNTITLYKNETNIAGVSININISYSPSTNAKIYIDNSNFSIDDYIDYDNQEIPYRISQIGNDSEGSYIIITSPMASRAESSRVICDWGTNSNVHRDFRPLIESPACNGSVNPQGVAVGALPCAPCSPIGNQKACTTGYPDICNKGNKTCQADGKYGGCVADIQPGSQQEICSDGIDNDCDGKIDCLDENCFSDQYCAGKQGLVLYLNMNNNTNDFSGNKNNALWINGNGTYSQGIMDKAAFFNGSDPHIEVPNNNLLNFGNLTDFSISVWFKTSQTSPAPLVEKHQAYYFMWVSPSLWVETNNLDIGDYGGISLKDNNWHHVVMVGKRSNQLSTYIDGVLYLNKSMLGVGNLTSSQPIRIGASVAGGYQMNGNIDEVMIYNRALNSTEVQKLYQNSLSNPINSCQEISQAGTYYLNRSLSGAEVTDKCINISGSNVVLDCQGKSIINSALEGTAIFVSGNSNTVRNCSVQAAPTYFSSLNNGKGNGILITGNNNLIEKNIISNTFWGIQIGGDYNTIQSNLVQGGSKGIHVTYHKNNIIKNNILLNNNQNQGWGLGIWGFEGNQLINNSVSGSRYGLVIYRGNDTRIMCGSINGNSVLDIYLYGAPNSNISLMGTKYTSKYIGDGAQFIETSGVC